jgi:DUF1680 family protein
MYAATKDKKLDELMDKTIAVMAKVQREDGYIYTKAIIEQKQKGEGKMFDDRLSFEAYNFGHLMTAACVHYRATGKTTLLEVAKKAADFLITFFIIKPHPSSRATRYVHHITWACPNCTARRATKKYLILVQAPDRHKRRHRRYRR